MIEKWQLVAKELRSTIEDFLSHEHSEQDLERVLEQLAAARAAMSGPSAPRWYEGLAPVMSANDERIARSQRVMPYGGGSPVSPVMTTSYIADPARPRVVGTVVVSRLFEGPAMSVHGGVVAGLFDHYMGNAQSAWSMAHDTFVVAATVELTVRYHARTPLDTELTFEASFEDLDEKNARAVGTCRAGDLLTASAEGTFRKLDPARFFDMQQHAARDT